MTQAFQNLLKKKSLNQTGLSDSAISSLTNFEMPASLISSSVIISALPPIASAASKAVFLTVIIFLESLLFTVAIQFPA